MAAPALRRKATRSLKSTTPRTSQRKPRRETLNLRIRPHQRDLIDRAAKLLGKTRTDFVLDASERAATDALLDQTVFHVSPKVYAEFLKRFNAPAQDNEKLRKLMQTKTPWG